MRSEKLTRTRTLTSPVFVEVSRGLVPSHIPGWERHQGRLATVYSFLRIHEEAQEG